MIQAAIPMDGIFRTDDSRTREADIPSKQKLSAKQNLAINEPPQCLQVNDVEFLAVLFALGSLKVHGHFAETAIV